MGISSSGIGSGLDVDGIIAKLMQAEAAPLANFDKKAALLQARMGALGVAKSIVHAGIVALPMERDSQ